MEIYLYSSSADNRLLDKSKKLTLLKKFEGVNLKENTSVVNPTFLFSFLGQDNIRKANYLYVPAFGRYYFINNIVEKTGRVFEIACHVDVLHTYKGNIKQLTALILRQENIYHPYIEDNKLLVRNDRFFDKKIIGKVGNGTDNYYITVNNGGGE